MRICDKFYINGEWVDPVTQKSMNVINPATEEACGKISIGSAADVDKAALAARAAFNGFSRTSRKERMDLLENIAAVYEKHAAEMAAVISEDMGAPTTLANTAQAYGGLPHFTIARNLLETFEFEQKIGNNLLVKEPIGVCGLITPWNWPAYLICAKVAPAIAMGCTMILKPSEVGPLSAYLFTEIMHEAGVPAGVFNMINGDGVGVGTAITSHPEVDMVSFTGSTRAGSQVAQSAAPTIKRVSQELGGKSANIILDDADYEAAIARGVTAVFQNSGQTCTAPTRMLVPKSKLSEIEALAAKVAETVVVGDPSSDKTTVGPVVSETQFNNIQRLIKAGIDEGATVVCGGAGRPDDLQTGFFVKPTIFSNVNNDMTIAREEIFGPVLSILPYESDEEAVAIANDTLYGLASYIQGSDMTRIRNIASQLRAGSVRINGEPLESTSPFGGYKQSGNGREFGVYGFSEYLELKAITGATGQQG